MTTRQLPEWMNDMINGKKPTCRRGTEPAAFRQAQTVFKQYGLQLEGHHLPYLPPYGGVFFVQGPDGTVQGAAVVKPFDEQAAEVRMAFNPVWFGGYIYAYPLLSAAIKLARELGYEALTTGDLAEDDPKHNIGVFYYENDFKPYAWHRRRSIFDEGSYLERVL